MKNNFDKQPNIPHQVLRFILIVGGISFLPALQAANAPLATTLPVTQITGTSATLNGAVTPNLSASSTWFQWGTNSSYGNQTAAVATGSGGSVVWTNATITGLIASQPYHYRVVASNSVGVTYGADQLFGAAKKVWAWGYDGSGQTSVPVTSSNSVMIAGGGSHSLGLNVGGTVTAWGDDYYGQTNVPASLINVASISGGYNDSMALESNGTVVVWGDNTYGQTNVPATLGKAVAIAAGDSHCLALQTNGTVVAWGLNDYGQTNVPAGLSNVVAIAAGGSHNLALLNNGTVVAWGDNTYGQTNVPVGLSNAIAISAGLYHCVALQSNGTVTVWGDNSYGQTNVPAVASNLVAISAGRLHTLALTSGGTVVSWGDDADGQTNTPAGLTNAVAVAAGGYHSLALTLGHMPIATPQTLLVSNSIPYEDSSYEFPIVLSGTDPDGDPITFVITSLPSDVIGTYMTNPQYGIYVTNTPVVGNTLSFQFEPYSAVPAFPFETFQFTANYGEYASAPATITINVEGPPYVTYESGASTALTNAVLTGGVAPNWPATSAWFQWGLTTNYGNTTVITNLGGGTNLIQFSIGITGLLPLTTYHFQAVASNSFGTTYGTDTVLETPPAPFSLGNAKFLPSGVFHITFTGTPDTTYSLWSSTNLTTWTKIGASTEDLPGQYEADDTTAPNHGQRFYQLRWP